MFTGIIEEIGTVQKILNFSRSASLTIQGNIIFQDLQLGDSVSVNGVCLTVSSRAANSFTADVMNETLTRSSLGSLRTGSFVNLERAMSSKSRFGGHIVSGHIDGTGVITNIKKDENAAWYTIKVREKIMRYIVEKGSVAIDGISLTVASVSHDYFSVSIIPHTSKNTVLSKKNVNDTVNIENDIIGKYVEKLINSEAVDNPQNSITKEFLTKYGY